jgi:hypothetical protein
MTYQPRTAAAKAVKVLHDETATAQLQWEGYATQLGIGYREAYKEHAGALTKIQENYRVTAESAYWVLSLLCVSFAGGLVGGLMAPWVVKAGETVGAIVTRSVVSGTSSQAAQIITQRGIDNSKGGQAEFKPAVKPPVEYWQDLLGEIAVAFSFVRLRLENWMKELDRQSEPLMPELALHKVRESPLLKHYPRYLPEPTLIQHECELGMWIAWAHVRHVDYWKTRMGRADGVNVTARGAHASEVARLELRALQPVVERMKFLGVAALTTTTLRGRITVLDVPKLQVGGRLMMTAVSGGMNFLDNVAELVKDPRKVLQGMVDVPPRYAVPGRKPIAAGPARRVPIAAGP